MSITVSTDQAVREAYEADSSGLHLIPDAVARPESISEVIELVRKAAADRTPITCAGAQTSTTGASITDNGMLLSLRSLNQIGELDATTRTVTVGPGALVGEIKKQLRRSACSSHPIPPVRKSRRSVVP